MQSGDLFADHLAPRYFPLPARLRPASWEQFVGQEQIVELLRYRAPHSMILYGPPGCGKTTLAGLLAHEANAEINTLSAVSAGVREVREVIARGRQRQQLGERTLLFIDEIHRFSKSQQDALLAAVELGEVLLIGATTENPSFEVIGPLLSRCHVYRLDALSESALSAILDRALATDPALAGVWIDPEARTLLLEHSAGDARRLLRLLELAANALDGAQGADRSADSERCIESELLSGILQGAVRRYDKDGENHYDYISAFIKSMRGSDPDAAILYLAVMLDGGEDPLFIARRMVIFAAEDVGNAVPQAVGIALSAFQALERIGMPEGRIILAQAATYLAALPKSNAAYLAIDKALAAVSGRRVEVPLHLRNAPTATHRAEGAGRDYRYPHDYPSHYVEQSYLPDAFSDALFYHPTDLAQEAKLYQRLATLRPERYQKRD